MNKPKPFRQGVGMLILNGQGQLWLGERKNDPGSWQLPQGGIDPGETLEHTLWRELKEETGLVKSDVTLLGKLPHTTHYIYPPTLKAPITKHFKGQQHTWFALQYNGEDIDLAHALHQEFRAGKWEAPAWLLQNTVAFKLPMYESVVADAQAAGFLPPSP